MKKLFLGALAILISMVTLTAVADGTGEKCYLSDMQTKKENIYQLFFIDNGKTAGEKLAAYIKLKRALKNSGYESFGDFSNSHKFIEQTKDSKKPIAIVVAKKGFLKENEKSPKEYLKNEVERLKNQFEQRVNLQITKEDFEEAKKEMIGILKEISNSKFDEQNVKKEDFEARKKAFEEQKTAYKKMLDETEKVTLEEVQNVENCSPKIETELKLN